MSEGLTIELSFEAQAVLRGLTRLPETMRARIAAALDEQNELTVGHIVATKLTSAGPRYLNVRTGLLRRSIRKSPARFGSGGAIQSAIGSNVIYAAIHEFGGKTKAHRIVPSKKKSLSFFRGGKQIFAKVINHPGSRMPERAYIRTSIKERAADYNRALSEAVIGAAQAEGLA